MRILVAFLWAVLLQAAPLSSELGVSSSRRFLTLNSQPFFWLGDTVWLLAQLPSNEELELYLKTRAEQGFTVIQLTAVMGEERVWGTLRKTSRGTVPFSDGNLARPNADYWKHLDYVLDRVHAHAFRAALVTYFVGSQGDGYKYLTSRNAYDYGKFLGQRHRGKPEIFWVLGGDNTPDTDEKKAVWNNVAKGIAEGLTGRQDYSKVLMTYHINGGASSAPHWHDSPWLDFNMAQTWSEYGDIYPAVFRDYQKMPPKPCGLGEGAYEDGPQYPTKPINALVIRQQASWSYFAGGYHTYGSGNVWHFDSLKNESTEPWKDALRSGGAESLKHVRHFFESVNWWRCEPDNSIIIAGHGSGAKLNVGMRDRETGAIVLYLCTAQP
jgi:hypothetical protein